MADAKRNASAAAPKGSEGNGKGDDGTLAKVTGVAIATGIAYSLYKSFVAGKKTEDPAGYRDFDHAHSEPFHEHVVIEKPEGLSELEAKAKGKASELKDKSGELKGAIEEKGRDVASAIKGKSQEVKSALKGKGEETQEWAADKERKLKEGTSEALSKESSDKDPFREGKEAAANKGGKAKDTGSGWFRRAGQEANKDKEEVDKAASNVLHKAGSEAEKAKEAGSNLFNRGDSELSKDKEKVERGVIEGEKNIKEKVERGVAAGEKNVEKAGAAVAGKTSELAHKILPGGKSGESAWSKTGASKTGGKRSGKEYGIVRGDTLWSISRRYGVTIEELKVANGIWNVDYIVAGDSLTIPN